MLAGASLRNASIFLYLLAPCEVRSVGGAQSGQGPRGCSHGTTVGQHLGCTVAALLQPRVSLGASPATTLTSQPPLLPPGTENETQNLPPKKCFLNANPAGDKGPWVHPAHQDRTLPSSRIPLGFAFRIPLRCRVLFLQSPSLLWFQTPALQS